MMRVYAWALVALLVACGGSGDDPTSSPAPDAADTATAPADADAADASDTADADADGEAADDTPTRTPRQRPLAEVWADLLDVRSRAHEIRKRPDPFEPEIREMTEAVEEMLFLVEELRLAVEAASPPRAEAIEITRLADQYVRRVFGIRQETEGGRPGMWQVWLDRADAPLFQLQLRLAPWFDAPFRDLLEEPDFPDNLRPRTEAPDSGTAAGSGDGA